MNASAASSTLSNSSACGATTNIKALFIADSLVSCPGAASSESLVSAFPPVAPVYNTFFDRLGVPLVLNAETTAASGKAGPTTTLSAATAAVSLLTFSNIATAKDFSHMTELTAVVSQEPKKHQQWQLPLDSRSSSGKKSVVMISNNNGVSVDSSSSSSYKGAICSTGGSDSDSLTKCSAFSVESASVGEGAAVEGGIYNSGNAGEECGGGSDCSTRSCASGSTMLLTKERANSSSDEKTSFGSKGVVTRPSCCSKSLTTRGTTDEQGEQDLDKNRCWGGTTKERSQGNHLWMREGRSRLCSADEEIAAARRGGCNRCQRVGHSRSVDVVHANRRDGKDRVTSCTRLQQQSNNSRRSIDSGGLLQKSKYSRIDIAARLGQTSYGRERRRTSSRIIDTNDFFLAYQDAIPEDDSIVPPACLLPPRWCSGRPFVADATVPAATASFCASSTVCAAAAVVIPPSSTGTAGLAGPFVEKGWLNRGEAKEVLRKGSFGVASSKREILLDDEIALVAAAVEALKSRDQDSSSSYLISDTTRPGTPDSAVGVLEELESTKSQEPSYNSTLTKLPPLGLVDVSSIKGAEESDLKCSGVVEAGAGARRDRDRQRAHGREGQLKEKEKKRSLATEKDSLVALEDHRIYKDMSSVTATEAESVQKLVTASKTRDCRRRAAAATSEAVPGNENLAVADNTHRHHYIGDTCGGVWVPAVTSQKVSSSGAGYWRPVPACNMCGGNGRRITAAQGRGQDGTKPLASSGSWGGISRRAGEVDSATVGFETTQRGERDCHIVGEEIVRYRTTGKNRGGGGENLRKGGLRTRISSGVSCSSSFALHGSEMAAGGERGRPGGLLLYAASNTGGGSNCGGEVKTAGCVGTMRGNDFRYNHNGRHAGTANMGRAATVMNRPTRVEAGKQRFLILDAPSDENLPAYIEEMKAFNVTHLVRTCEATYDDTVVREAGICTHEWIFPDGEPPPEEVIDEWLTLCNSVAAQQRAAAIAVHCVAGLGRAPVLVAVALIEKGMDPMDAIMFIRERRKGAINRRQLQFLKSYRRRSHMQRCCIKGCSIM